MAITALPTPPTRDDPTNFAARGDAFLAALPTFTTEANAQADTVNIQTALTTASSAVSAASSKAALGAANYKGLWSSLTGALAVPASATHSNIAWLLVNNVADVTLSQPGVSADWVTLGPQPFEIGDIKQSTVAQDANWLSCDGSEYTTATYPTLGAALPNTSYDLQNSSATMFSTSAGSVAYNGTNTYVMVDNSGTMSSSTDGVTWVERFVVSGSSPGALTYAGGYFCVGTANGFYYSADGIGWTFKYVHSSQSIREVRFGASLFVALGDAASSNIFYSATINGTYSQTAGSPNTAQLRLFFFGTRFYTLGNADASTNVWYSTDANSWTPSSAVAPSQQLYDMDYDGTTNYVVCGTSGALWYSTNGTTWTQSSAGSATFAKVRFANGLWVVCSGASPVSIIYTSTSGSLWTSRTTGLTGPYWALAFGNGKWVLGAGDNSFSRVAHSTDGITWTIVTAYKFGDPSTNIRFVPLIYAGGKFVYSNGSTGVVHTATDAAGVWTVGKNQKWIGLNPSGNSDVWYADNGAGTLALPASTGVLTTTDQVAYTYRPIASGAITGVNRVDYVGNAWFASGATTNNALYRSTDAITWSQVSALASHNYTSVNYNGSQYLATLTYDGASGKVRTSTDGLTWTERTVGGTLAFYKSFWFNNAWFVYSSAALYRSTDGITWTVSLSIATGAIQNVKIANGFMFVLTSRALIQHNYSSYDGLAFSKLSFQGTVDTAYDVEYFSGKYVITAKPYTNTTLELRNTIWHSTDATYFYPAMMPQEYADTVWGLKAIGSTLYALGTYWIYTSKDGVSWARFAVPRVSAAGSNVALINYASKVVLHTTSASFPASTTKFRVPEPTLQLGAPSFIKANYS